MAAAVVSREEHERVLTKNQALEQQVSKLQNQVHALLTLFKSGRSERRPLLDNPGQGQLFDLPHPPSIAPAAAPDEDTVAPSAKRRKSRPSKPQGVANLPDHLERREETIEPELDPECEWECIGTGRTEILEREPGQLYVRVILRPKYKKKVAAQNDEANCQIVVAPSPDRPLAGRYVGAGLLAWLIVNKLVDHQPFYRQIEKLRREDKVVLPKSTVNDWFAGACTLLKPLYELLLSKVLATDYAQVDESRIEVLTTINKDKDGKTKVNQPKATPGAVKKRRGWMWVVHDPVTKFVVFNFDPSRGKAVANSLLNDFGGYLQVDGYVGYADVLAKSKITYVACAAHIRRKFHAALANDPKRAQQGVDYFARMYALESQVEQATAEQRHAYRNEHLCPVLKAYQDWLLEQQRQVTPKSQIGKAISYALNRHEGLENVLLDGRLRLDNNLIENTIRPLALGRKNYLFAGSDTGAQRLAMMYSLMGSCKAAGVNPLRWLHKVLEVMPTTKVTALEGLLPGNLVLGE